MTNTNDPWSQARRLGGLRRFAAAITVFNVLGHTVLGFEQSWAQPLVSLATAYTCELLAEWMDASGDQRPPRFRGGPRQFVDFLLPAHITGLAVAMLLYASDRLAPIMFAAAVAIASKSLLHIRSGGRVRHFLNPSNFGITMTLLLFPWVSIAPPYHFSENLRGIGQLILPALICASGTVINIRFTSRMWLILGWWGGFVAQAVLRSLFLNAGLIASLNPMTGVAFVLFSYYMITDPATTPFDKRSQLVIGFSVAAAYGVLVILHVAFGFFFALTLISAARGLRLFVASLNPEMAPARIPAQTTTAMRKTA